jgi:hypothetical protein
MIIRTNAGHIWIITMDSIVTSIRIFLLSLPLNGFKSHSIGNFLLYLENIQVKISPKNTKPITIPMTKYTDMNYFNNKYVIHYQYMI